MKTCMLKTITFLLLIFYSYLIGHTQFAGPNRVNQTVDYLTSTYSDLDGDGFLDLVINKDVGTVFWFKNDGTGAFGSPQSIQDSDLSDDPALNNQGIGHKIKLADVDNNGSNDLLYVHKNGLCIQSNDGSGNFGPPIFLDTILFIRNFEVGDMDGDGDMDVVINGQFESGSYRLFYLENYSNFEFSSLGIIAEDVLTREILMVDLNNDTNLDLLTFDSFSGQIVLRLNDGDGTGNLAAPSSLVSSEAISPRIIATDINQDGNTDLILLNGTQASWLNNLGGGVFGSSLQPIIDQNLSSLVVADFNNDNAPDIAFCGTFDEAPQHRFVLYTNTNDGTGSFDSQEFPSPQYFFYSFRAADLDGDGRQDLSFREGYSKTIYWIPNSGQGNIFEPFTYSRQLGEFWFFEVADLDGDGFADFVAGTNENDLIDGSVIYQLNDGLGQFDDPIRDGTNFSPVVGDFLAVDSDLDGDIDIITPDYWLRNTGDGNYSAPIPMVENIYSILHLADLNGDGFPDLVVWGQDNSGFGWLANDGAGNFSGFTGFGFQHSEQFIAPPADLDGDGDLDIVASYIKTYWYANDGNGNFSDGSLIGTVLPNGLPVFFEPTPCDIDGDGDLDILSGSYDPYWFENVGGGSFDSIPHLIDPIGLPPHEGQPTSADLDNDGDLDVLVMQYSYDGNPDRVKVPLTWFENLGAGNFGPPNIFGDSLIYENCKVADLDGDGDLDIAFRTLHQLGWYENIFNEPFISGACFLDENENGLWDAGELPLNNIKLTLSPSNLDTYVDENGAFRFFVSSGDYLLSYISDDCFELTTPVSTYEISFTGSTITGLLFGFKVVDTDRHIQPFLASNAVRCGLQTSFWITIGNDSCTAAAGQVALVTHPLAVFADAVPMPSAITGDTIWWNYDTLASGASSMIRVELQIADANFVGDTIHLNSFTWIDQPDGSFTISDSTSYWAEISCAYDPNDKLVNQVEVPSDYWPAKRELLYTIRFQNTGNDTASTVSLRDSLSPNLDWSTLRPIGASHPYYLVLNTATGLLQFEFDNIALPDSTTNERESHGFVQYVINLLPDLNPGTLVNNRAGIYFDANPVVLTNTAQTKILSPVSSVVLPYGINRLNVFPNPGSGEFEVRFDRPAGETDQLYIRDTMGRLLIKQNVQARALEQRISLANYPSGIYFVQWVTSKQTALTAKILLQK
ncbi:MAG: hypothetical protein DHS20C18_48690 [Saprospiraceae bacterium]|nr:MAG: hypothetical protein DHS20C18_48690 [Saprospiraceae bacterium]